MSGGYLRCLRAAKPAAMPAPASRIVSAAAGTASPVGGVVLPWGVAPSGYVKTVRGFDIPNPLTVTDVPPDGTAASATA